MATPQNVHSLNCTVRFSHLIRSSGLDRSNLMPRVRLAITSTVPHSANILSVNARPEKRIPSPHPSVASSLPSAPPPWSTPARPQPCPWPYHAATTSAQGRPIHAGHGPPLPPSAAAPFTPATRPLQSHTIMRISACILVLVSII